MAADSQMPIKAQQHYAYISPLLGIVAIASVIIALFAFLVNSKITKLKASVPNVIADMDAIYEPNEVVSSQRPSLPDPTLPDPRKRSAWRRR